MGLYLFRQREILGLSEREARDQLHHAEGELALAFEKLTPIFQRIGQQMADLELSSRPPVRDLILTVVQPRMKKLYAKFREAYEEIEAAKL